ncbi:MAG TPA: hypothetical protein VMN03_10080 [Burkholderiales bacterium]|nr:hypothetical protein [Burkholderiales bacterium]
MWEFEAYQYGPFPRWTWTQFDARGHMIQRCAISYLAYEHAVRNASLNGFDISKDRYRVVNPERCPLHPSEPRPSRLYEYAA